MAATVQAKINNGAGPTVGSAEGGITFGQSDEVTALTGTTPPSSAGTVYSWYKYLHLGVDSGGGSTNMLNRQIKHASAPSTGLTVFWKDGSTSYTQATGANKPSDNATTNDATPAGYTAMSTSYATWDAASAAAVNSARNGNFVIVLSGVSSLFASGGGIASLPTISLQYQEE